MFVRGASERLPGTGWVAGTLAGHPGWPGVAGGLPGGTSRGLTLRTAGAGAQGSSPRALGHGISGQLSQEETDRRPMDTTTSRQFAAVALPALLCLYRA